MITLFKSKVLIKINYKSGISESFWVVNFLVNSNGYKWDGHSMYNNPLDLATDVDSIESVWVKGRKVNIFTWVGLWIKRGLNK